jgi:hypothetical protein
VAGVVRTKVPRVEIHALLGWKLNRESAGPPHFALCLLEKVMAAARNRERSEGEASPNIFCLTTPRHAIIATATFAELAKHGNQPVEPTTIVTDGLTSYGAALRELGLQQLHRPGRLRENNRAENSHLPIRKHERQQQGFKSKASAQRFLTTQASIYNTFYTARHLINRQTLKSFRAAAHEVWLRETCA